ncbi:serine/threonine-protein kinase [uncultured Tolumonas sp.]|uniref:serine/threonine-protein kinase n=1 Tax=uncultured Tolumonas sp. TaxID=263765 RepID=UPI002A0A4D3A|nr:serine/threonine-protein kinase [uncultured Tolumonas sp.]
MNKLHINTINAPQEIKDTLLKLSAHISFTKEIAKGANGYLFLGINTILEKEVAVKFYYWGNDKIFHAEPRNLAAIESPNILKIHSAALIDNDWAYFITECCNQGDLDDFISTGNIGNIQAVNLVSNILSGLSSLHSNNFIHRDLKPSNIYLNGNNQSVIGDFGSVKRIPVATASINASGHSILYRPPESTTTNQYSIKGDLYQVGMVLYQLLGGYLPYSEQAWLDKKQLLHYNSLQDPVDKTIYVDQCIKNKISTGKILNIKSLPCWVPNTLIRVIKKATNLDPNKRYSDAASFQVDIHKSLPKVKDWHVSNDEIILNSTTSYKIISTANGYKVLKKKSSDWREDHQIKTTDLQSIIDEINGKT